MTLSNASIWGQLRDLADNNVYFIQGAGAPTSGTTGTGVGICGPASEYFDITNKVIYRNTGTIGSVTWTLLTSGGSSSFTSGTIASSSFTTGTISASSFTTGTIGSSTFTTGTISASTFTTGTISSSTISNNVQSVAAVGTNQTTAASITSAYPGNILVTAADATVGVKLPASAAGAVYFLKNGGNNFLKVYANSTDTINAVSAGASYSLSTTAACIFMCVTAGVWYTIPLVAS